MFHDRQFQNDAKVAQWHTMAWNLNPYAVRLALLVDWHRSQGYKHIPVQAVKRLGFTRRHWELATKGTRAREGRTLIDPAPAKDGLEYTGQISEATIICEETGRPKTFWLIGEIDAAKLEYLRELSREDHAQVIEDPKPEPADSEEIAQKSNDPKADPGETEYERGYCDGEAHGYDKGWRDAKATGCVYDAPHNNSLKDAPKTHPENAVYTAAQCEGFAKILLKQTYGEVCDALGIDPAELRHEINAYRAFSKQWGAL